MSQSIPDKPIIKATARACGVKLEWFNTKTRAFVVAGTRAGLAQFRSTLSQDIGGIMYHVTDNGSYPTYGSRIYTPMEVA